MTPTEAIDKMEKMNPLFTAEMGSALLAVARAAEKQVRGKVMSQMMPNEASLAMALTALAASVEGGR